MKILEFCASHLNTKTEAMFPSSPAVHNFCFDAVRYPRGQKLMGVHRSTTGYERFDTHIEASRAEHTRFWTKKEVSPRGTESLFVSA